MGTRANVVIRAGATEIYFHRIYDGYPDVALDMISSRTFDGRIQLLEYAPTVLSGRPGSAND